jgi:glycerophosphoryl diester phosphodiesterase
MYKNNAQIYDSQFVIRDSTTLTSSTSGGLIIEGGVAALDTFVTGHVAVNEVDITPNPNDFVLQRQFSWNTIPDGYAEIPELFFVDTVTSSFTLTVYAVSGSLTSTWQILGTRSDGESWSYTSSFTGDLMDVDFQVSSSTKTIDAQTKSVAQVLYTTSYSQGSLMYRASTTTPFGVTPDTVVNTLRYTSGSFIPNAIVYGTTDNRVGYASAITYDSVTSTLSVADLNINGNVNVGGNIVPDSNEVFDLGSESLRWRDLWLSGDTIHLGETQIKYTDGSVSLGDENTPISIKNIVASGTSHTLGNVFVSGDTINSNVVSTGSLYIDGKEIVGGTYTLADTEPIVYLAHRGQPQRAPQSTAIGFKDLISNGFRDMEFDLRMTTDGNVFLFHDENLSPLTDGTGNIASVKSSYVRSLSVDGQGSVFGDQPLLSLVDAFEFFKHEKASMFIEGKVTGIVPRLIKMVDIYNIDKNRIAIADFTISNLAVAKNEGFRIVAQFGGTQTNTTTAQTNVNTAIAADADYITINHTSSDAVITTYVNNIASIPVFVYTFSRRFMRDRMLALGVKGIYTDDIEYTKSNTPFATQDAFSKLQWMPGMFAVDDILTENERGRMQGDGWWGWSSVPASRADGANTHFVLQGWACPIKNNIAANDYTIEYSMKIIDSTGTDTGQIAGRWGGVFIHDSSMGDQEVREFNTNSPTNEKGYVIAQRKNGNMFINYRTGNTFSSLINSDKTALTYGVEYHYRIVITPTSVTFSRLDSSGGNVVTDQSVSVNNTDVRGGYFSLGTIAASTQFRNVRIL